MDRERKIVGVQERVCPLSVINVILFCLLAPEKPFGLHANHLSPTELNITWMTNIMYDAYHVKHGTMESNLQDISLTRKFYVLSKLKPNTRYIVQVYAEKITKNDNQKVNGEATQEIFTTGNYTIHVYNMSYFTYYLTWFTRPTLIIFVTVSNLFLSALMNTFCFTAIVCLLAFNTAYATSHF